MIKKLFLFFAVIGMSLLVANNISIAQGDEEATNQEETVDSASDDANAMAAEEETPAKETSTETKEENTEVAAAQESGHELLKKYFIQGGPGFMGIVLVCLILGLAFAIERIISLNLATTNTNVLLGKVEGALQSGNVDEAKEICKNTKGPVASIFYQGLNRVNEGVDMVEKSIVAYGSVQMGLLEKGLIWISLFIGLAPMLGFMGTVIGMIEAFDAIEVAGDISPGLVAGGIKVALLTTVFGLIVAIILQIFYNYIISKVDDLVNGMEDASISFVDLIVKHKIAK